MIKITFIYILIDPQTYFIRYVGKADNPQKRFLRHLRESEYEGRKSHKDCWIKSLKNKNLIPFIKIIAEVEEDSWIFWEKYYIKLYKALGYKLTNGTEGGDCGPKVNELSPESRKSWSEKNKLRKRKHSEETIKKMILAAKTKKKYILPGKGPVNQYDLNGNFVKCWRNAADIHKELGFNPWRCFIGKQKSLHGYIWERINKI